MTATRPPLPGNPRDSGYGGSEAPQVRDLAHLSDRERVPDHLIDPGRPPGTGAAKRP